MIIKRQLSDWLKKVEKTPQIVHVLGLRQTGKTTLMQQFRSSIPTSLHYPFQDYIILNRYQGNVGSWVMEIEEHLARTTGNRLHVFIDEVQKIPNVFQALQGLYDKHKGRIKFWIWGSSARPLKKKRAETLAGRFISKKLFPLSQAEIYGKNSAVPYLLEMNKMSANLELACPADYFKILNQAIRQSMLPEPFLMKDRSIVDDLIESYQASYLENEIRRENLVADIGNYSRFLVLAASENGSTINYSSIGKHLGLSSNTVKTYYDILEDTYAAGRLHAESTSMRVQISKSPKIYFSDTGMSRFLVGERGVPEIKTKAFGHVFESYVYNEIRKQIEYYHLPWRLSYLRTKSGNEVDLIITCGREKIAVEIKAKSEIDIKDCKGIRYMMEKDPTVRYGVVISLQGAPLKITDNIYNFPAWNL